MIKEVVRSENELIIYSENGSVTVPFLTKVIKFIIFNNSVLVLTNSDKKTYGDRNIFRISEDGQNIWQVGQPTPFRGVDANRSAGFTYLGINKEGKIRGGSLNSCTYDIDFETGQLSNEFYSK